jgi:tetratricopeptide (TPR) repeat protein
MPRELSSTAKAILDQMDSLFENDLERNTNYGATVTPPRFSKTNNKESLMNSPELSLATYRTTSSTITKCGSQGGDSTEPSGMVISAEQKFELAEEAIMDPTWLDSEEEEEDLTSDDKNKSFISVCGSLLSGVQSDDSKSRSYSFGSSISVGSCGFGKSSLCDLSISSIGSKNSHENHLLDMIDMGMNHENYERLKNCDKSASGGSGDHELEYLYNLDRSEYDSSEGEDTDASVQCSRTQDDSSEIEKSAYLPPHLITPKSKKRHHFVEYDEVEKIQGDISNSDGYTNGDLHSVSSDDHETCEKIHSNEENSMIDLDIDIHTEENVRKKESSNTSVQDHSLGDNDAYLSSTKCQAIKIEDDFYISDKMENVISTSLPSEPLMLLNSEAGIFSGDLFFSLFDCLGSKTRKKRALKSDKSQFKWGHHVFRSCIERSRYLRMIDSSISARDASKFCQFSSPHPEECLTLTKSDEIDSPSKRNESYILDLLTCHKFQEVIQEYETHISLLNHKLKECDDSQDSYAKYQKCINVTYLNLGIIYLMTYDYSNTLKALNSALETFADDNQIHLDVLNFIACANYAMGYFESAHQIWTNALTILNKIEVKDTHVILAQIYNNIGCCLFEISSESNALTYMKKSIALQNKFTEKEQLLETNLCKIATIRGNIAYLYFRMKRNTLAVRHFESCLRDCDVCLDAKDEFIITALDYLAITFLRIGKDDEALKLYSKILTLTINKHNGAHDECTVILNKINLLQNKGKKKKNVSSKKCMLNIYNSIEGNQIQQERFEKLLKSIKLYTRRADTSA